MRNEGRFILRYRVFNIFGKVQGKAEIPVLAAGAAAAIVGINPGAVV